MINYVLTQNQILHKSQNAIFHIPQKRDIANSKYNFAYFCPLKMIRIYECG